MMADQDDRYATIGSAFLGKVAQRLTTLKPEELSAADVARWTDVAIKLRDAGRAHTRFNRDERLASILLDENRILEAVEADE
jgi:hypothetical protein